jgi:ATP-dependent DNA helicase
MDASCLAELPVAALPGPIDDAIITSSMREEETRLQKETAMTSAAEREQALVELNREIEQMRYQRLQHLLERSNFFSDFLLEKMTKELNMGSCIGLSSHDQEAGRRRKRKMKCKAGERKAKRSAFEDGSEKIPGLLINLVAWKL